MIRPFQKLYHGTSKSSIDNILLQGIVKKNHNEVYLTADLNVAYKYAKQHDNSQSAVICIVDAVKMYYDGYIFNHDVSAAEYTVSNVPVDYITIVTIDAYEELSSIVDL